ncbi:hypothetical protein EDB89DRAFT_2006689 [Lactarius sanguifluus]|nr:hypothetical protein EDB89DRAFT_2006689 [Lactarius sanguifluus]
MRVPTRRHSFPSLRQRAKRPRGASPTSRACSPMAPDTFVRGTVGDSASRVSPDPYDAEDGTGFNGCDTLARQWNKPTLGVDAEPTMHVVWRDRIAGEEDESTA